MLSKQSNKALGGVPSACFYDILGLDMLILEDGRIEILQYSGWQKCNLG